MTFFNSTFFSYTFFFDLFPCPSQNDVIVNGVLGRPGCVERRPSTTTVSKTPANNIIVFATERISSYMNFVYFISGHLDLTPGEFAIHYIPALNNALQNPDSRFVLGDGRGADYAALSYLKTNVSNWQQRVTIYHMLASPRREFRSSLCPKVGGFPSDDERDAALTRASTHDIAWVRLQTDECVAQLKVRLAKKGIPFLMGRVSGTEKNIARRIKMANIL